MDRKIEKQREKERKREREKEGEKEREKERERERKRGDLKQLSVHQWLRSAICDSQQPTFAIGFLFLKLPPPPCAVLLVYVGYALELGYCTLRFWRPGDPRAAKGVVTYKR